MKRKIQIIGLALLVTCQVALTGCVTLSEGKTKRGGVAEPVASKPNSATNPIAMLTGNSLPKGRPDSIVAIWKDATYTVSQQQPTRGFGGRLYFYDQEKNPIVVDGELVVYGFNDSQPNPNNAPEKKFVFTREELQDHMSVSSAGPSYSVWLPWDRINSEQKEVTLIAMFKEAGPAGRICYSEHIPALLPGKKPQLAETTDKLIEEIQLKEMARAKQVGFDKTKPDGTRKIKSHEIRIPEGSEKRLFGQAPKVSYRLPEPKVIQASATEPIREAAQKSAGPLISAMSPTLAQKIPSTGSSPDQRQARNGRFERQGTLPPGSKPPLLGVKSAPAIHP